MTVDMTTRYTYRQVQKGGEMRDVENDRKKISILRRMIIITKNDNDDDNNNNTNEVVDGVYV